VTVYRVGPAGATVFNEDGRPVVKLRPGQVVVPGTADAAETAYERHAKRVRRYDDKAIHPTDREDKHVLSEPVRQAQDERRESNGGP
jgi:hypothetical protein